MKNLPNEEILLERICYPITSRNAAPRKVALLFIFGNLYIYPQSCSNTNRMFDWVGQDFFKITHVPIKGLFSVKINFILLLSGTRYLFLTKIFQNKSARFQNTNLYCFGH